MKRFTALLAVLLLTGSALQQPRETHPQETLEPLYVHFVDVGQADCILLQCGDTDILIDGGNHDTGAEAVGYLAQHGVDDLELVVNTHPHGDHIGGLPTVLSVFDAEKIWCSTAEFDTNTYSQFCDQADRQGVEVEVPAVNETYTAGDLTLTVIGPLGSGYEDLNDTSLVIMAQYGEKKFLFAGDMEALAERELVEAGTDLKADLLKVGHHGSYSSTCYRFLREVDPDYAVIMCGRDNAYGHPHEGPLSRLLQSGAGVWRVDKQGDIVAVCDGQTIAFFWERGDAVPTKLD